MLRLIARLVLLLVAGILLPGEAAARLQLDVRPNVAAEQKLAPGFFDSELALVRLAATLQAAQLQQAKSSDGYELAPGCTQAAENGALRFTQTTASPWFSAEGNFAGQTISDVAGQLRSGALTAADVPVTVVGDGLIVNTRSSLALTQAGIPQSQWTLLQGTAQDAANIAARLSRNGLGPTGTGVLRITGSGSGASTLIGSGTILPPVP